MSLPDVITTERLALPLWTAAEVAAARAGERRPGWHPARHRFGLTVEGRRQWIWLDSPDGPDTWPVPAAPE